MDEPFASVDAQTRGDLEDLILEVRDRYDMTILFVTHDIDESVYLSDRIVVLSPSPTEVREILEVPLPSPRDQVETKELPEFARLRAHVYRLIKRRQEGAQEPVPDRVTAALLAAGTALCYGVSNFAGPRMVRDLPLYPVLISGQLVALVVSSGLLLTERPAGPRPVRSRPRALAGAGNAVGLLAFYRAAAIGPLSIAAPLGSLGAVVPGAGGRGAGRGHRRAQARRDRDRADRRGAGRAAGAASGAGGRGRRPAGGRGLGARLLVRLRGLPRRHVRGRERRGVLGDRAVARLAAGDLRGRSRGASRARSASPGATCRG